MAAGLTLVACASTVQVGHDVEPAQAAGAPRLTEDGLALPPPAGAGGAPAIGEMAEDPPAGGAGDGSARVGSPAAGEAAAGGRVRGDAPGGTEAAGPRDPSDGAHPAGEPAPGVTDDTIFLGFSVTENGASANDAIGAPGVTQGQPREYVRIVVEDLNRRGGLAGRKVEPVIFAYDAASATTDDQQHEQACAYWTQDNEVFAAAAPAQFRDSLRSCMGKRGIPLLGTGLTLQDATSMAAYPRYAEIGTMNLNRISRNLVKGLSQQEYFRPQTAAEPTRVGILRFDYPTFERASNAALKPALRARNVEVADEFAVRVPANSSDLGGMASDINAAILRFRQRGVNHVLILETTAILAFTFMRSAENQQYRPQYGLHSQNGGQVLAGLVPPEQLQGSVGIGWMPQGDVRESDMPSNPSRNRCLKLLRDNGIQFPDANAKAVALNYCDQAQMFKAAIDAGRALSGAGFINGVEAQGSGFVAATTFATRFSFEQHDGAAAYRHVRFVDACTCFRYVSGVKRGS